MARAKTTNFFVWIILGLLFVGLIGFGAGGLGGNIRTIGSVGDKDIAVTDYAQALQAEIRAAEAQLGQPISFPQAQQRQLDRIALQRVVSRRALDAEASLLGLSVGDERVRDQVLQNTAFRGTDGTFDRDNYRFSLQQAGLTEARFEASLREEMARTLLQAAVASGITSPPAYADTITDYIGELRDVTWLRLDANDLRRPIPEPSEDELMAYYEANTARFTEPEKKRVTYVWLTPGMIQDSVEIDEETIRALYDDRISEFSQPERRLVERLVFADTETAEAAKADVETGATDFETLVSDRGLSLADVDLGDVDADDLGEAGDAVFNAEPGSIVGPFDSGFGPALFRINAVLDAQETPFEDARDELREELAAERARRVIDDQRGGIDDLLAGGATLEEIADETEMQLGSIDWFSGESDAIAAYDEFAATAAAFEEGDFAELVAFEDGGIFAARLDEVVAPRVRPLEEVREAVVTGWEEQATVEALQARVDGIIDDLAEVPLSSIERETVTETGLDRQSFIEGFPPEAIDAAFEMQPGEVRSFPDGETLLVMQLDAIEAADLSDPENAGRQEQIAEQAQQGIAQDMLEYYTRSVLTRSRPAIDEAARAAVHAQFQ